MSKSNTEVHDTIEIIATYTVHTFYNIIYEKGKKLSASRKTVDNITDGYKIAVKNYVEQLNSSDRFFTQILSDIHGSFCHYSKYRFLSMEEWIKRMVFCFIPSEYHGSVDSDSKNKVVNRVIKTPITQFAIATLKLQNLRKIIDDHDNPDHVHYFQDLAVDYFTAMRESIYSQFVSKITGSKPASSENNKYKKAYNALLLENRELRTELDVLRSIHHRSKHKESSSSRMSSTETTPSSYAPSKTSETTPSSYAPSRTSETTKSSYAPSRTIVEDEPIIYDDDNEPVTPPVPPSTPEPEDDDELIDDLDSMS